MKSINFFVTEALAYQEFLSEFNDIHPNVFWQCFYRFGGLEVLRVSNIFNSLSGLSI